MAHKKRGLHASHPSTVDVVGTVTCRIRSEKAVTLQPLIAGSGPKNAKRIAEGVAQAIGDFEKDVPRSIAGPLTFTLAVPPDFDPANQWLVFQFGMTDRSFSVFCETNNLLGLDASGNRRWRHAVCWGD